MPDISTLKAQRASLADRLTDVMAARERLKLAQDDEATILAEIGTLGRNEIEALRAWARTGEGDKPAPGIAARTALHDRLVAAQTVAETARGASVDLESEQREIAEVLQRVNAAIDAHAFDVMQREHAEAVADLQDYVAASVVPRIAHVLACRAWLTQQAQGHQAAGRTDQATDLFRRGEALDNAMPGLEFGPTAGGIIAAAPAWGARFADLTGAEPARPVIVGFDARRQQREQSIYSSETAA